MIEIKVIHQIPKFSFSPSPISSMASPTQGLALTHNCLRVHHPQQLVDFYTQKFGMKLLGNLDTESGEQWFYLGFADAPGKKSYGGGGCGLLLLEG